MAIVAVVSGPATMIVHNSTGTMPNPDAKLIEELNAAGVRIVLCSQAAHGRDLTAQDLLPHVRMDVSAITTIAALQMQGYGFIPD